MTPPKPLQSRTFSYEELQEATLEFIKKVYAQLYKAPHEDGLSDNEFVSEVIGPLESKIRADQDVIKMKEER